MKAPSLQLFKVFNIKVSVASTHQSGKGIISFFSFFFYGERGFKAIKVHSTMNTNSNNNNNVVGGTQNQRNETKPKIGLSFS